MNDAELKQVADRFTQFVTAYSPSEWKMIIAEWRKREHRTNQQIIFHRLIRTIVLAFADIPLNEVRYFIDGRNEATYNWCVKAVANDNDPIFPLI